jgi:flagellar transcriptional activator FlhD
MNTEDILSEIRDANLQYLLLAQQMIRQDLPTAIYRLGISDKVAQLISSLTTSQTMKLAANVTMLTRFRFDDSAILGMLTHDSKESFQSKAHAAILLASQPVEEFA